MKYLTVLLLIPLLFASSFIKDFTKSENKDTDTEIIHTLVKEINDIDKLKEFLSKNQVAFIEIYSPHCPHCKEFAPKYDTLSLIYQDKIPFVKIDGSDPKNYRPLVTIKGFPSLFFYENEKFYEYQGIFQTENVRLFIEKISKFNCTELPTLQATNEFIKERTIEGVETSFVLGVIQKKMLPVFVKVNNQVKMSVESCYYYLVQSDAHQLPNGIMSNTVIAYNEQKGLNTFSQLRLMSKYSEEDPSYFKFINKLIGLYRGFVYKHLHRYYEDWDETKLFDLLSRSREYIIFTYSNEEQRLLMEDLATQYSLVTNLTNDSDREKNYLVLLFNINGDPKKYDPIWKYYPFASKPGVYVVSHRFSIRGLMTNPEEWNVTNIDNMVSTKQEDMNKIAAGYVTAKIVNNLDEKKNQNETNMLVEEYHKTQGKDGTVHNDNVAGHSLKHLKHRNRFFTYTIYLIIYSIIFYFVYRKLRQDKDVDKYKD